MTNLQKTEIKEALSRYLTEKDVSQQQAATYIGISSATLSHIINEKWERIDNKMWRKVRNYIDKSIFEGMFTTTDHNSMVNACNQARKHKLMVGIIGDTGMGKTQTLKVYGAWKRETYYIRYGKTMKPRQFFVLLLRALGISFEGSIHDMVERIAEELNENLDSPLLIIDEAGKITHTMILYLHELRDKTDQNCGIVLAGMPYFKANLEKFSSKEKEGYAEFTRRVNLWQHLKGLSKSEIIEVLLDAGITDEEEQREFLKYKKFAELVNEILLHKTLNTSAAESY